MGEQVTAAFITPDCRAGRGDQGAWDEAVARLKTQYDAVVDGWRDEPRQPTLKLILDLERPGERGLLHSVTEPAEIAHEGGR